MSKIDNPYFGKVGAFWVEGNNEPFYGINDARDYQLNKGGDILNHKGKVIIHAPEPAVVEEQHSMTPQPTQQKKKSKGFLNFFGF